MPEIILETHILAPVERVFDLARSIDLHIATTGNTHEKAIAGKVSGLIGYGETVTWEARHFGVTQRLKSEITGFNPPSMFEDTMLEGIFAKLRHVHSFEVEKNGTLMRDNFYYQAPCGFLGRVAERVFLTRYLEQFIKKKNAMLKDVAESDQWKAYLK